ncbi:hypothetical protein [Ottowia testudinis]|uniref:Uncharacterized protein n=1 Tax=Ottowia testudinis TaxID=2816950 RepID=A0A975CE75_9BURK|nr:hypothetical protein [Ottowia testudinis]QTD43899.1 hypothetical protein J1M35_12160 [Ottowia testudinis]
MRRSKPRTRAAGAGETIFAFPFQRKPLIYALLLSLCGLLVGVFIQMGLWLAIIGVVIGFMLAVSRYAFKVMALASSGMA